MKIFFKIFLGLLILAQALQGEPVLFFSSCQTTVYLVRHGQTDANIGKIPVGASHDVSLNATGRGQSYAARKLFDSIPFKAAYTSNLKRSIETASILLSGRGIAVTRDPRFRERDRGTLCSLEESSGFSLGLQSKEDEHPEMIRKRVLEGLDDIAKAHPGETVLLVGHGLMMKHLLDPMIGVPYTDYKIDNLDYVKLVYKEGRWIVSDLPKSVPASKEPIIIFLVRHGETEGNLKRIIQGSTNVPLNDAGIRQAQAAKTEFEGISFDAAYTSDLIRAKQTAAIVLEGRGINAIADARLRERDFGCFEGIAYEKYYALPAEEREKSVESEAAVARRVQDILQEIALNHPGQKVFIASHWWVIKYALAALMGRDASDLHIGNLAYAKLIYKEGRWTVAETKRIELPSVAISETH